MKYINPKELIFENKEQAISYHNGEIFRYKALISSIKCKSCRISEIRYYNSKIHEHETCLNDLQ